MLNTVELINKSFQKKIDNTIQSYSHNRFSFCVQLSGSLVFAVGLWLRFDPSTATLLNEDGAPETFFFGK